MAEDTRTRATAAPNFALVKYWGKADDEAMMPAVPSLSMTLEGPLVEVSLSDGGEEDRVWLDGTPVHETWRARTARFLDLARQRAGASGHVDVRSVGGMPPAAGLASSAAFFAALARAAAARWGLGEDTGTISDLARMGSVSASRSVPGGWVVLDPAGRRGPVLEARTVFAPDHWDVTVIVAVVDTAEKQVASSDGMRLTRDSSPYYGAWVDASVGLFEDGLRAVGERDMEGLARVAERSCMMMHASAMACEPPILYLAPATLAVTRAVTRMRASGLGCLYTIDAGPQVKVVCAKEDVDRVREGVLSVPGVLGIMEHAPGAGCRLLGAGSDPPRSP